MNEMKIRRMTREEVKVVIDWAAKEGWNPGLNDAELFFTADEKGFFVGELDDEIIAVGSAICYDENYVFCGLYIVRPDQRGKGYGLVLTEALLEYCGDRNVGIDGVLENVEIYQRFGFKPFYMNYRFQTQAEAPETLNEDICEIRDFDQLVIYDRQCFPAQRKGFLKAWLSKGRALAYYEGEKLCGYAVRRQCLSGYKVGPLFADSEKIATELFSALQSDILGELVILDVPENNVEAMNLAKIFSMDKVFATMRMYRHGLPDIDHSKIFGITTFELG